MIHAYAIIIVNLVVIFSYSESKFPFFAAGNGGRGGGPPTTTPPPGGLAGGLTGGLTADKPSRHTLMTVVLRWKGVFTMAGLPTSHVVSNRL